MKDDASMAGHKPNVALIGLRGSGKTTIGRLLGDRLGVPWIDTDEVIVARTGQTIAELFGAEGESGFRVHERAVVRSIAEQSPRVISLGAGTVDDFRNMDLIRRKAKIVWLVATLKTLWSRIQDDSESASSRPSLTDRGGLEELRWVAARREDGYRRAADYRVETDQRGPAEVVEEIARLLDRPDEGVAAAGNLV